MGRNGKYDATLNCRVNINMTHPLVKLAQLIDWSVFEREWAAHFPSNKGRPASWWRD